ncbi:MAG: hypothetical protein WBE48_23815 [Xanthobacteraceae bacterium]
MPLAVTERQPFFNRLNISGRQKMMMDIDALGAAGARWPDSSRDGVHNGFPPENETIFARFKDA